MSSWRNALLRLVDNVEDRFDALRYRLNYALGGPGPIKIVAYNGYGTQERLYVAGRVLEDQGIKPATENDTLWRNLLNMYRRIESDEVPHARLAARFQGREQIVQADKEGMFDLWIEPNAPLPSGRMWQTVDLELLEPRSSRQEGPVRAEGKVLVPPPTAQYGVISDIDDTVIRMDVTHLLRMARTVFLGNAYTRLPFPGVAGLYRALHAGPSGHAMNPLFYVSSSPWNLYDLLVQFFHLHDIPVGPVLFLRNWGISENTLVFPLEHQQHKLSVIRQTLELYRDLPFILIGDSGQQDPEIYHQVVEEHPKRIMAVYIRNVSAHPSRPEAIRELAEHVLQDGSSLVLADDSYALAEHAAEHGWIAPEALPTIAGEKERDEQPPSPIERLLGDEAGEAPTVVIEEGGAEADADAQVRPCSENK